MGKLTNHPKWFTKWRLITTIVVMVMILLHAGISYYQANYCNANITINGIKVGGLTAVQALQKLETTVLKNEVYGGEQQFLDGEDTKMAFLDNDLPAVKKLLSRQKKPFLTLEGSLT
ncbi:hypothetical protein [Bacillus sp. T33-2]|uniref:hypothetical protein n=1 Tax=Bacillus sp. T33-2 TaxID=2054168 RepID=UPI000C775298|nr:hypothetical protein [Bacillus sp. T33-2]PLR98496.1 hypothetical protein CVD19_05330 [Bacillus sp. T33-2]